MIVSNRPPFCKSFVSDSLRKNDKAKEIVNSRKIQSLFCFRKLCSRYHNGIVGWGEEKNLD